jgi:hypothetical protein
VSLQGLYPNHHTDVEVTSGDDDASKTDALAVELRAPASVEAESEGISLAEPIAPGLIRSNTPVQADPSLPLLIRSFQVLHLLVGRNKNVHRPCPNANLQSFL